MSRIWRWSVLLTGIVSGVLCACTIWLWVRSYGGPDYVQYVSSDQWSLSLISGHGTLDVLVIPEWRQDPEFRRGRYDAYVYYGTRYSKRFLGFGTDVQWPEYGGRYVNIPHWFVAGCTALIAALCGRVFWRRSRRHRLRATGRCTACGYDLRATPGRCPECGAQASAAAPA